MTGTVVRIKGLKRYFDKRDARWYCYHRATNMRIQEEFGTAAFFERVAALDRKAKTRAEARQACSTLHQLILDYKSSEKFTDLAIRTRSDYDKVFQYLEPLWHKPLHHFTKESLVKLRRDRWKKERGRRFVNYIVTVLKIVFVHGVNENHIESNPLLEVQPIRRGKTEERLNRRWGDDERLAVWNAIKYPLKLPYALAVCYGVREGDMPSIPRSVITTGFIKIRTRKRGVWINMPIMPEVQEAWDEHRAEEVRTHGPAFDSVVLCTSSRGAKWTQNGFRASFFKFLKRLETEGQIRPGCTYHGLRHSVASDIAEHEGTVEEDINAVLGQRKSESARAYIEEANRTRRAHATVAKLDPFKRKS